VKEWIGLSVRKMCIVGRHGVLLAPSLKVLSLLLSLMAEKEVSNYGGVENLLIELKVYQFQ
jgi:hypothetical protein